MSVYPCPCCSHSLLRHISSQRVYWYCRHCHQAMPNLSLELEANNIAALDRNLNYNLTQKVSRAATKVRHLAIKVTA